MESGRDARRRFVVVAHRAATTPVNLNAVTSEGGRWDLLARCANAALLLSHGIRRDAELWLVLRGGSDAPKTLRWSGATLQSLNPDERSTCALAFKALAARLPRSASEVEPSPGLFVSRRDLPEVLDALAGRGAVVVLDERAPPLEASAVGDGDVAFVLGDTQDLTGEEEALLARHGPVRASLGPHALHADHCIVLAHAALDRRPTASGPSR